MSTESPFIQEMGLRDTSFGCLLYVKVRTPNNRQLSWTEIWQTFSKAYPGRWAMQFFPPAERLVDEENVYHLFVMARAPAGVDVNRSPT